MLGGLSGPLHGLFMKGHRDGGDFYDYHTECQTANVLVQHSCSNTQESNYVTCRSWQVESHEPEWTDSPITSIGSAQGKTVVEGQPSHAPIYPPFTTPRLWTERAERLTQTGRTTCKCVLGQKVGSSSQEPEWDWLPWVITLGLSSGQLQVSIGILFRNNVDSRPLCGTDDRL